MQHVATSAAGPLSGRIRVPGDKSISHRAVLFAAMAEGTSHLTGVLDSADVRSTMSAVGALGAQVALSPAEDGSLRGTVVGWGSAGPSSPESPVDCGNSGTTARLLLGVLAGYDVTVTLVGDDSLSTRPMKRVTEPLSRMGARFETTDGHLPVTVRGSALTATRYESPVGSAQVKTAILLAGLRADGTTTVGEPALSRDHTERLLPAFGVPVDVDPFARTASLDGPATLRAADVVVPGDPSSAAFMAIAAAIVPDSHVTLDDVSLNPTRCGFLRVLERMGADITLHTHAEECAEPVGSIEIRFASGLHSTTVTSDEVPSLIDEIPILAVAAAAASGTTRFEGVGELKVKESDRLIAIHEALSALGVDAPIEDDVLEVEGVDSAHGSVFGSATLDSLGDHRLAMAWSIAALAASGPVAIDGFDAVAVSYPGFLADLETLQ